jgi:hypothetical protein
MYSYWRDLIWCLDLWRCFWGRKIGDLVELWWLWFCEWHEKQADGDFDGLLIEDEEGVPEGGVSFM